MDTEMQLAVDDALTSLKRRFGTYGAAAAALGISRQALGDWRTKGRVSVARCRQVSRLTGIPTGVLRPDVYGPIEE
jgi:Bacterial toxin YdaS